MLIEKNRNVIGNIIYDATNGQIGEEPRPEPSSPSPEPSSDVNEQRIKAARKMSRSLSK